MIVTLKKVSDHGDESKWKQMNISTIEELLSLAKKNSCREVIVGKERDGSVYVEIYDDHR